MSDHATISILGAGSFGTAVARVLAIQDRDVLLLCRTETQAELIRTSRENREYFPGHPLPRCIDATSDLERALRSDVIVLAVPARNIDVIVQRMAEQVRGDTIVVNLVKGLHEQYFTFASLFEHYVPQVRYVSLKGPTFARPLFLGELSGFTCGTDNDAARRTVTELFRGTAVDLDYLSSAQAVDAISAIKNAYAIALGIAVSLGLSDNTIYLLVTRVLREVKMIVRELGFGLDDIFSYCGLGDILLTGFCDTSRNRILGIMVGKGLPVDPMRPNFLAEGVRTVFILLKHLDSSAAPILKAVLEILEGRARPMSLFDCLDAGAGRGADSAQ